MRKVIFHYHLFKNAGTSVDAILKRNFGAQWVTREFSSHGGALAAAVAKWIVDEPDAVAFSSHTALLPPPVIAGVEIFPIVFVRHPIDRIASAYEFERRQGGQSFGAVLARHTSLAGYVEVRLSIPNDRQCRNFHVARLSTMLPATVGNELERAHAAVQRLPFIGIVETFQSSMRRLENSLRPTFPDFDGSPVAKNVGRDPSVSLAERLQNVRENLGDPMWNALFEANGDDFALYDVLTTLFARDDA